MGLFLDNFNFKVERIIKRTKCNHKCYSISGLSVERFNYLAELAWEHWHANYTKNFLVDFNCLKKRVDILTALLEQNKDGILHALCLVASRLNF